MKSDSEITETIQSTNSETDFQAGWQRSLFITTTLHKGVSQMRLNLSTENF